MVRTAAAALAIPLQVVFHKEDGCVVVQQPAPSESGHGMLEYTLLPGVWQRLQDWQQGLSPGGIVHGLTASDGSDRWLARVLRGLREGGAVPLLLHREMASMYTLAHVTRMSYAPTSETPPPPPPPHTHTHPPSSPLPRL